MGLLEPDERHRRGAGASRLRRAARKAAGEEPKALVIHSLDHALAALRAAKAARLPVVLMSGRGAAGYAGPAWFAEVVAEARSKHPRVAATAILDCAHAPGRALAALRAGIKTLRLSGNPKARARVAAIARQLGAALDETEYSLLDLGSTNDPERAARMFLDSHCPLPLSPSRPAQRQPLRLGRGDKENKSPPPLRGRGRKGGDRSARPKRRKASP